MSPARMLLILLGAEFIPLMRFQPGRGTAMLIMVSLILKNALYQYLPISPVHAVILHAAAAITGLYLVVGLFGFARIRMLMLNRWDTGRKWLSFGASDKTTLFRIEPILAVALMGACIFAVAPPGDWGSAPVPRYGSALERYKSPRDTTATPVTTQGSVFRPFWHYFGFGDVDIFGQPVTVYGRHLPGWFNSDAVLYAGLLPFLTCIGLALNNKHFDWRESPEYLAELRTSEGTGQQSGTLTFTTVEEVR